MALDYSTPLGQLRLLISDVDEDDFILSDSMVEGYLALNPGSVRYAAADALDAIATSEALVGKVIRTQDVQTDAAKLADSLRAQARSLRARADAEDAADGVLDVLEFQPYPRAPYFFRGF